MFLQKRFHYTVIFILLSLSFLISSCKKEDPGMLNGEFDKKVLVEEFTAEWCGFCTQAAPDFNEIIDKYGDEALCVGVHYSDFYEVSYPATALYLFEFYKVNGLPGTLVNRNYDETREWIVQVEKNLGYKSNAGIKLETDVLDNKLNINVHYTANKDYENILLSVYLVEDHVVESSPGAQSGGGGNFIHRNVLREVLTSKTGNPVTIKTDSSYVTSFTVSNISKYKKADLKIMAFLNEGISKSFEFINGNQTSAGLDSGW